MPEPRPYRMTLRTIVDQDVTVWATSRSEARRLFKQGEFEDESEETPVKSWVRKGSVSELGAGRAEPATGQITPDPLD